MHKVGRPNLSEKVKLIWYCVPATLKPQMSPRHSIIVVGGNYWSLTILKIVLVERMLLRGNHVNRSCAMLTLGRVLTFSITNKNVWSLNPQIMGVFLGIQVLRYTTLSRWVSGSQRLRETYCIHVQGQETFWLFSLGPLFPWRFKHYVTLKGRGVTRPRTHRHVPEDLNTPLWESLQTASFLDWQEGEILLYIWRRKNKP
jgi:hypothetical protein